MDVDASVNAMALPHMAHGRAKCHAPALFVRDGPGTTFKALGYLVNNEDVTVWAVEGQWWLIQTAQGLNGYAFGTYLQPVEPLVA